VEKDKCGHGRIYFARKPGVRYSPKHTIHLASPEYRKSLHITCKDEHCRGVPDIRCDGSMDGRVNGHADSPRNSYKV
jgi:hypothetical protein